MEVKFHKDVPEKHRAQLMKPVSRFYYGDGPPYCDIGEFPRFEPFELAPGRAFKPAPAKRHRYLFEHAGFGRVRVKPA